jgi:glycosyltransferase involved in cell wall biosynthesis
MGIYENNNQEPRVSDGSVSICIPAYNRPALLGKLLLSILSQTYRNFEIIVTDNSDNFETQLLLQNHFTYPRVRYFRNTTNLGMGANTRKALSLIKGEFFPFTPDDDLWVTQSKLESQVTFFRKIEKSISFILMLSQ